VGSAWYPVCTGLEDAHVCSNPTYYSISKAPRIAEPNLFLDFSHEIGETSVPASKLQPDTAIAIIGTPLCP
jgi:hypothetical protein